MDWKRKFRSVLLLGVCLSWMWQAGAAPCLGDATSAEHFSVYVIPRQSALQLHREWAPFLERLGRDSGLCFELSIPDSFAKFEQVLRAGRADFAFLNPWHQVMVARSPGYVPLVRDKQSGLAGVLVVRKDSPIRDVHQLDGKTLVFPAPNAYVGSLLLRAWLAREHVAITPDYVGSHDNVYRAVALGMAPAGGGANTTLENEPTELQSQLRVLFTTPFYVPHPFSAHPRVPPRVRDKLSAAFLKMHDDAEGRKLLKAIQVVQPVRADYDRDYRELESLSLERFAVHGGTE